MSETVAIAAPETLEAGPEKFSRINVFYSVLYLLLSVSSFLLIFIRMTPANLENETALANVVYNILTFTSKYNDYDVVLNANAVIINILFFGIGVLIFLLAAENFLKIFIKNGKVQKALEIARLAMAALTGVLFAAAYPSAAAALTEFGRRFSGETTVFFWMAYILPCLCLAAAAGDVLSRSGIWRKKWKLIRYAAGYAAVFLLSVTAYALPLIIPENGALYMLAPSGFRTLFGENRARSALLLISCSLLSFSALAVHILREFARQTKNKKLREIAEWIKLGLSAAFVIIFVYCLPAALNLFGNLEPMASDTWGTAWKTGAGAYMLLAVPVLALFVFLADGVRILQKIEAQRPGRELGRYGAFIGIFSSLYAVLAAALWISLSVPYGYHDFAGYKSSFFVLNYKGAATEYIGGVVPNTVVVFTFAITMLAAVLTALVFNGVWNRKFLGKSKTASAVCFYVKPLLAVTATALFFAQYYTLAEYARNLAATPGGVAAVGFVPVLLKIAVIGILVTVWLDALFTFWTYYKTRVKNK